MSNQRINYLTLASVISAFAVVMLHTNSVFWLFSTETYWLTANFIESVMYFAVPVFFMISGATLIDYRDRYTTKEFFQKRINKALMPFVVWSIFGVVFMRLLNGETLVPMEPAQWKEIVLNLVNNNVVGVYWFFGPLFCAYLCIPLFSAVEKNIRMKVFQYLVGATLIFNILLPFLNAVFSLGYSNWLKLDVTIEYLFFVLVGYILNKRELEKKWRIGSYIIGLIGLLLHMVGTYVSSVEAGSLVMLYKGYVNLPCVLYSIAIFVFIKEIGGKIKNKNVWRFINWAGKYTFAIYLMHWFVMTLVVKIFQFDQYTLTYRIGGAVFICAICIFITWIMRKIPILKKIVP